MSRVVAHSQPISFGFYRADVHIVNSPEIWHVCAATWVAAHRLDRDQAKAVADISRNGEASVNSLRDAAAENIRQIFLIHVGIKKIFDSGLAREVAVGHMLVPMLPHYRVN
jgi:hypothetical protein